MVSWVPLVHMMWNDSNRYFHMRYQKYQRISDGGGGRSQSVVHVVWNDQVFNFGPIIPAIFLRTAINTYLKCLQALTFESSS